MHSWRSDFQTIKPVTFLPYRGLYRALTFFIDRDAIDQAREILFQHHGHPSGTFEHLAGLGAI